ncbi:MAG: hypothetical protein U0768_12255 [Anaerolineae bacterium]
MRPAFDYARLSRDRWLSKGAWIVQWNDNRETLWTHLATRDSLFLWALQTHGKHRRRYPAWLAEPQVAHLRLVRLRSPREADAWLAQVAQTIKTQ